MVCDGVLQHFSGLEEAVFRNINACKELSQVTRTSLGPNGKNKMIVNNLEKLFVTNDAATIMKEMEVMHPAARILVMGSDQQQKEVGDASNFVVVFAGELLQQAEGLIRMGLHPGDVIEGYKKASQKALELLDGTLFTWLKAAHADAAWAMPISSFSFSFPFNQSLS